MSPIDYAVAILSPTTTESIIRVRLDKEEGDVFVGATDGLTPDTEYDVRYQVYNTFSSILSESKGSFKTFALGMPVVYTDSVINITYTSAMVCTTIKDDGGSAITQAGFCYSTSPMPTVEDDKVVHTATNGAFRSYLNDLTDGKTYYVRAFATNAKGTSYGRELCFTTEKHTYHMGHEYIDLGLPSGVKWATANLGDSLHAKYGDYYAWGETKTKTDYSWSTYQYGSSSSLTKYNDVDKKTQLELSDDAANAVWGGDWRMPTSAELAELYNNCDWTKEGYGYRGTSRINGKSIFLAMGGCMTDTSIFKPGEQAYYWTSTLSDDPSMVHVLYLNDQGEYKYDTSPRYYGCFIRPVYPKK